MTTNLKRIALIGPMPPYRGGITRFTVSLAEKLVEAGHDVLVISFKSQYPKLLYPGKNEKDFSQPTSKANTLFIFSPLKKMDWKTTFDHIQAYQPDFIIYQWWTTFWAPATAWLLRKIKQTGIKTKVLVHNAFPHESTWLDKKLASWALKDAQTFVTMTEAQADRLRSAVHHQVEIQTAPHPIYSQFPASGLSKPEVRRKLRLPMDVPIALFFGFVRPYKGLGILLEAMATLNRNGSNLHLVVAGEFWDDQDRYEKQIVELGIREIVTIRADYIPDSEAGLYFEAADLFVAPYTGGTQSGSIKVAMSYQLPLVITDAITDPLILTYPFGYCVAKSGDPQVLTKKIAEILLNRFDAEMNDRAFLQDSWQSLLDVIIQL